METYGSKERCPCKTCQPTVHVFNKPILTLYKACSDQVIMGASGAVALNDVAIISAMNTYFVVDDDDKLYFSLQVRKFFQLILSFRSND